MVRQRPRLMPSCTRCGRRKVAGPVVPGLPSRSNRAFFEGGRIVDSGTLCRSGGHSSDNPAVCHTWTNYTSPARITRIYRRRKRYSGISRTGQCGAARGCCRVRTRASRRSARRPESWPGIAGFPESTAFEVRHRCNISAQLRSAVSAPITNVVFGSNDFSRKVSWRPGQFDRRLPKELRQIAVARSRPPVAACRHW